MPVRIKILRYKKKASKYNRDAAGQLYQNYISSLSHTTWRCQYLVFATKYHRMVIYRQIKKDIVQSPFHHVGEVLPLTNPVSGLAALPWKYILLFQIGKCRPVWAPKYSWICITGQNLIHV